jgi:hypothetical protein
MIPPMTPVLNGWTIPLNASSRHILPSNYYKMLFPLCISFRNFFPLLLPLFPPRHGGSRSQIVGLDCDLLDFLLPKLTQWRVGWGGGGVGVGAGHQIAVEGPLFCHAGTGLFLFCATEQTSGRTQWHSLHVLSQIESNSGTGQYFTSTLQLPSAHTHQSHKLITFSFFL